MARPPVLVSGPPPTIRGRRVLVVDETCDTGSTMKLALSEVRALHPAEVRSAVSFKTGEYAPDFHAFETDNFIILPWDREIIQGGEIVMRPDYAARSDRLQPRRAEPCLSRVPIPERLRCRCCRHWSWVACWYCPPPPPPPNRASATPSTAKKSRSTTWPAP